MNIEASKLGGPELLTIVEEQTPYPTDRTLLVEIRAAGLNYADVMARSGFYPRVPEVPFPLGFEIAGVVKAVGKAQCCSHYSDGRGYATHAIIPSVTAITLSAGLDYALAAAVLAQGVIA